MKSLEDTLHPTDWTLVKKVFPFIRPYWAFYTIAILLAPVSALVAVLQPWLLQVAIDQYILVGDVEGLQKVAMAFLALALLSWILEAAYMLALANGAIRTITLLRTQIYRHTIGLSRSFYDGQPVGRLMTRATSDVEALGETLTAGSVTIVLDILKVTGILIAMMWLDLQLTLVLLLLAPVVLFIVEAIRRVLRRLYLEVRTSLSELNAFTAERFSGLKIIQLYRDETRAIDMYVDRLFRYRRAAIQTNIWDAALYAIMDGLRAITMALMLWYGSGGLLDGMLTAGLMAAFIEYVDKLYRPIQEFSAKVAILQRATSALEKIFGLLDIEERVVAGDVSMDATDCDIRIDNLRFSYADDTEVLKGINIRLKNGEVVALVGRTGSGKTTIGRLLSREYDGYSGSIRVNDIELATVERTDLRNLVQTVRQDAELFNATVRFNLTLGREVDDALLWKGIEQAQAMEVVESLGGLDGQITQRGQNLSAGEMQLLSIARVMVHEAPVVVLDEATANVDSLTEARIQRATEALLSEKTVLVIAHRLSTITHANRIVLLDGGTVLEQGSHQELIRLDGAYAALYQHQFVHGSEETAEVISGFE